jgi:hypothetical protein
MSTHDHGMPPANYTAHPNGRYGERKPADLFLNCVRRFLPHFGYGYLSLFPSYACR